MRNLLFYVISALFAGLIVYFGINPIKMDKPEIVKAQKRGEYFVFSANDVSKFRSDNSFAITKAGQGAGAAIGLRMVSFKPFSDQSNDGVFIDLDSNIADATKAKPVIISIVAPPIFQKVSEEFAIGLSDGKNIVWAKAKPKPESDAAILKFDAPPEGIKKIIINPDTKGKSNGIDVISFVIRVL